MSFKIKGLDRLSKNIKDIAGKQSIPISDLMNDEFISSNTNYKSFKQLLDASGFKVETENDFKNIPDNDWENHIIKNTQFKSWSEMQQVAGNAWVMKKIRK